MPVFTYKALNNKGAVSQGDIDAADRHHARCRSGGSAEGLLEVDGSEDRHGVTSPGSGTA